MFNFNRLNIYKGSGYALSTKGINDTGGILPQRYVLIDDSHNFFLRDSWAFELKFRVDTNTSLNRSLFCWAGGSFSSEKISLRISDTNNIVFSFRNTSANTLFNLGSIPCVAGTDYHIVVSYEKSVGVKLFINNVKYERLNADTYIYPYDTTLDIKVGFRSVSAWNEILGVKRYLKLYEDLGLISDADAGVLYNSGYDLEDTENPMFSNMTDCFLLSQVNSKFIFNKIRNRKASLINTLAGETIQGGNAWQAI